MYFGIFLGWLFATGKSNIPNTEDVYIGDRRSGGLYLRKFKQIRKGTKFVKYQGMLYPIIPEASNIWMHHLNWDSPMHIIDSSWASDIQGIQTKYIDIDNRSEEDLKNLKAEIEARKNDTNHPATIKLNINPIFKIAAEKLYKLIEGEQIDAAFRSIVSGKALRSSVILYVLLGVIMGGMGSYIITNNYLPSQVHDYTTTQTLYTTCPTSLNLTETTSTYSGTLPQSCVSTLLSSVYTNPSSSIQSSSPTVVNITSFTNGTIVTQWSNGSKSTSISTSG